MRRIPTLIASTAVAGALLLAGCGSSQDAQPVERRAAASSTTSTTTAAPAVRPTEAVDRLVPIGAHGERMRLTCTGSGAETVLLISGFGDAGESWAIVASQLEQRARVCVPVRFGLGDSDAPSGTQTFATEATALHELLAAAGEPGPYVVVGHSFGGAEAVAFAAAHPEEVVGLALVDASPTTWPDAACAVPDDGSGVAASFASTCASFAPDANPERLDAARAFAEVARVETLGGIPMVVVTRAAVAYPGLDPKAEVALADAWNDGQDHWASLSSASQLVPVEGTGHVIQHDQPDVVIAQVGSLLS